MRRFAFVVCLCASVAVAAAERPKIGLVLGGGGARGAAHIGVISVLEELRVPVDLVVGTSMGAIVGGLYASGQDAEELEQTLRSIDWTEALRDVPERARRPVRRKSEDLDLSVRYAVGLRPSGIATPPGVLYGQHLSLLLRRQFTDVRTIDDFDELGIPFRAVATDLSTGERVVLGRGDLARSIRASMSVPGAFAPVHLEGRTLIDGYAVENVPVAVARELGCDVVIAVNVGSGLPDAETLQSAIAVSLQSSQIMVVNRTAEVLEELGEDDVLIHVELGTMSGADFARAVETIEPGRVAATKAVSALERYAVSESEYQAWQDERRAKPTAPPVIREIVVDPSGAPNAVGLVRSRIRQEVGEPFDRELLEDDLDGLYGIGRFASIDYELQPATGGALLVLHPLDKPWGPTLMRFGLGFADDFDGGRRYLMNVETLTHGRGRRGREWRVRLQVGDPTGVRVGLYQPFDLRNRWFTRWRVSALQRDLDLALAGDVIGSLVVSEVSAEAVIGRNFTDDWELAVGVKRGHAWIEGQSGFALVVERDDASIGRAFVDLTHDTLDDFALPSSGRRLEIEYGLSDTAIGATSDNARVQWQWDEALGFGRRRFLVGLSGAASTSSSQNLGDETLLGGLFRLSGYRRNELIGNEFLLARLVYFDTSGGATGNIFGTPVVVGASVEYGDTWEDGELWRLDELRWAGSVFAGFDTLLGSFTLGYGRAERGRDSIYFSFGPLFGIGRNVSADSF